MDPRLIFLVVPSALVLGYLVLHSARSLPRRRAIAFWVSVVVYGLGRGIAVRWIADRGLHGAVPYVIHDPLLPVFGVPVQEIVGWAIVAYLGWWFGHRLAPRDRHGTPRMFPQVAWAALFLAAVSWAVEAAAVAAGWWHWTVPVRSDLLLDVPWIGPLDWGFVAVDFLLPFIALTAPSLAGRPVRFLALLAFPLHFAAHFVVEPVIGPIPGLHVAHWVLLALLAGLALRSGTTDDAFDGTFDDTGRLRSSLPLAALGAVLVDLAVVDLFLARQPLLLLSILPVAVIAALAWRRAAGLGLAAGGIALAWVWPAASFGALPTAVYLAAPKRRAGPGTTAVVVVAMALAAWGLHGRAARAQDELVAGLERAVAARDRGALEEARRGLLELAERFSGETAPRLLLAEIDYRTGRLESAGRHYRTALEIKPDLADAHRHLAVIALRQVRLDEADRRATEGLRLLPSDPELLYLRARARRDGVEPLLPRLEGWGPLAARALVGLAFEVDDAAGAERLIDRALDRWPDDRWFYRAKVRLALGRGDDDAARAAADAWSRRFPDDPEPRGLARRPGET